MVNTFKEDHTDLNKWCLEHLKGEAIKEAIEYWKEKLERLKDRLEPVDELTAAVIKMIGVTNTFEAVIGYMMVVENITMNDMKAHIKNCMNEHYSASKTIHPEGYSSPFEMFHINVFLLDNDFCLGNVYKYLKRYYSTGHAKSGNKKDVIKAIHYMLYACKTQFN